MRIILVAKLVIKFYPIKGNSTGYNPRTVTTIPVVLFPNVQFTTYTGAITPIESIEDIMIYQMNFEYTVNAEFFTLDNALQYYQDNGNKFGSGDNNVVDMYYGQYIGEARVLEYAFVERGEYKRF